MRDISKAILGRSVPRNPQKIPAYESLRWYPFAVAQSPGKSDADTTQRASRHGQDRVLSLGLAAYVVLAIAAFSPAPLWDTSRLASTPFGTYGFGEHASSTPDGQLLVWPNTARECRARQDQLESILWAAQASLTMTSRSERSSCQPRSSRARSLLAIAAAGSPGRRSVKRTSKSTPVTRCTVSTTWRFE